MLDRLGEYEVRGTLGRGAMGVVYDGWDPALERRVAIKTVKLDDAAADEETEEGLARFRRGAQAAGRLSHANIVGVFAFGETDEIAYIVMEFIEGRSLKDVLDEEKMLPPGRVAEIMVQVLAGLEYSHRRGVVHRDIKPANVMLTADGQVKLADFGIARIASSNATAVGVIMGTPAYMPAEQFMGEAADARSDIYAAGAMLFHLLTGSRPYEGSPTSIMTRVLHAVAPPVASERSVSVSPVWDPVIARAMARRPEDRFQSAGAFAAAVRAAAGEGRVVLAPEADATMVVTRGRPVAAREDGAAGLRAPGATKRNRVGLVAGGLVAALGAAVAGWLLLMPGKVMPDAAPVAPAETTVTRPAARARNKPTPLPVPSNPSSRTPAEVRDALAAALVDVPCTSTQVGGDGTVISVDGFAGDAEGMRAVARAVAAIGSTVDLRVKAFPSVYCPAVDVLRPVIRRQGLEITIPEAKGPVKDGTRVHPTITSLPFDGWVQVFYLSSNGTVFNVLPMPELRVKKKSRLKASDFFEHAQDPPLWLPAGATLRLGQKPHVDVGPALPFGRDMFVAITSSLQLFPGPLPENETVRDFAAALQMAVDKLHAQSASVAAAVALMQTVAKTTASVTP